jgi:hypothetical protein
LLSQLKHTQAQNQKQKVQNRTPNLRHRPCTEKNEKNKSCVKGSTILYEHFNCSCGKLKHAHTFAHFFGTQTYPQMIKAWLFLSCPLLLWMVAKSCAS